MNQARMVAAQVSLAESYRLFDLTKMLYILYDACKADYRPIYAVSCCENSLSVDKSPAALINVQLLAIRADGLFLQNRHHPWKLAELSLVIGLAGNSETNSFSVSLSASNSFSRYRLRRWL